MPTGCQALLPVLALAALLPATAAVSNATNMTSPAQQALRAVLVGSAAPPDCDARGFSCETCERAAAGRRGGGALQVPCCLLSGTVMRWLFSACLVRQRRLPGCSTGRRPIRLLQDLLAGATAEARKGACFARTVPP